MFFVAFEISVLVFYCLIFYLRYFHFFFKKMEGREGARCLYSSGMAFLRFSRSGPKPDQQPSDIDTMRSAHS